MDLVRFRSARFVIVPLFYHHYFTAFGMHFSLLSVSLLILSSFALHIFFHPSSLDYFPLNSDSHPVLRLARLLTLRLVDFGLGRPLVD